MSNIEQQQDHAGEVVARLAKDYAELANSVASTLARMRELPKVIVDEATLDSYATVIRDARDLNKRLEGYHDAEKIPYLRAGQGVDQFFFGQMEKLAKRKKTDPAGGIDILDARVDDFMQEKHRRELAERQRKAIEEKRKADEAALIAEEERRKAQEAIEAAARARKPEKVEEHREAATVHAVAAQEAASVATQAAERAEDARIDTIAPAADMVRTRLDSGAMATMGTVPFVQIDDVTKLDKNLLWPFLKEEHVLMALKAWAKTKSHKTSMEGATIELRNKGQVR